MKKILITATIVSMLSCSVPCAFAQDGAEARLSGVYQAYNEIKVIHNVDNTDSIAWYTSKAENGTYNQIADENSDTYKVKSNDSGLWLKAVITDSEQNTVETEPRQIDERWTTRYGAEIIDRIPTETPSKYTFTVGGMEFILLDTTEDDESRFLVMTKKSVGNRCYSEKASQSFANLAAFLNNLDTVEFYYNHTDNPSEAEENYSETGYIGNSAFTQLPDAVLDAINNEQVWKTEPVTNGQAKERCYKAGIVVPAVTEIMKYAEKIGWRDNQNKDTEETTVYSDFWLRTPSKRDKGDMLFANAKITGGIESKVMSAEDNAQGLRLMFYLDKDFFLNNKPENPGQEVLNVLWSQYSKAQLLEIYTQEELTQLGYIDFAIEKFSIDKGEESSVANVTVSSRLSENKDIVVLVAVYDSEGMLIGANMDTVSCTEGMNEREFSLSGVNSQNYASAMAVILDSAENPAPVYKAMFIK